MAQFVGDVNRKLVPRWRSSDLTLALGDMKHSGSPQGQVFDQSDFEEKIANWSIRPTLSSAAELVSSAFVHARLEDARDAAQFILSHDRAQRGLLHDLALRATVPFDVDDPDEMRTHGEQIRAQRQVLAVEQRNPFGWVDLARNYLLIGRPRKAAKAMEAALGLAPDNRFVLRSAVRLYLHIHEPARALWVLNSSDALLDDPALIAPEIAVSAILGKVSRLFKRGYRLLDRQNDPPSYLCELAAVLATEELHHGPGRKARQLFKRSLASPNENTVAQVRWAASKDSGIAFDAGYLYVPRSYEARAWSQFYVGEWDQALLHSKKWLSEQGFSRRPAALGSFVAAVIKEDHLDAISILRRALVANPRVPLLLNNLAYSLASIGEIEKAEQTLRQIVISHEGSDSSFVAMLKLATEGFIEFRKGNPDLGCDLYAKAHQVGDDAGLSQQSARLTMFWAIEELRTGKDLLSPSIQVAVSAAERSEDGVLRVLANRIRQRVSLRG